MDRFDLTDALRSQRLLFLCQFPPVPKPPLLAPQPEILVRFFPADVPRFQSIAALPRFPQQSGQCFFKGPPPPLLFKVLPVIPRAPAGQPCNVSISMCFNSVSFLYLYIV